jgi:phage shock protein PspC (stress-responsive transcriptional regulator)
VLVFFQVLGAALALYLFVVFIAPKGAGPWGRKGYVTSVVIVTVLFGLWLIGTLRALLASFAP